MLGLQAPTDAKDVFRKVLSLALTYYPSWILGLKPETDIFHLFLKLSNPVLLNYQSMKSGSVNPFSIMACFNASLHSAITYQTRAEYQYLIDNMWYTILHLGIYLTNSFHFRKGFVIMVIVIPIRFCIPNILCIWLCGSINIALLVYNWTIY